MLWVVPTPHMHLCGHLPSRCLSPQISHSRRMRLERRISVKSTAMPDSGSSPVSAGPEVGGGDEYEAAQSALARDLEELERQEDQDFENEFLNSDSDVNEYPGAWFCPFLPSPVARVSRIIKVRSTSVPLANSQCST